MKNISKMVTLGALALGGCGKGDSLDDWLLEEGPAVREKIDQAMMQGFLDRDGCSVNTTQRLHNNWLPQPIKFTVNVTSEATTATLNYENGDRMKYLDADHNSYPEKAEYFYAGQKEPVITIRPVQYHDARPSADRVGAGALDILRYPHAITDEYRGLIRHWYFACDRMGSS